jgi:hypothetical protein
VLWTRSYWRFDSLYGPVRVGPVRSFVAESVHGQITVYSGPFTFHHRDSWPWGRNSNWGLLDQSVIDMLDKRFHPLPPLEALPSFYMSHSGLGDHFFHFPYWLPILVLSAVVALPWIRWRFSLRSLLLALTLVAAVLGLIVAVR